MDAIFVIDQMPFEDYSRQAHEFYLHPGGKGLVGHRKIEYLVTLSALDPADLNRRPSGLRLREAFDDQTRSSCA
jgi:hypothetical protein